MRLEKGLTELYHAYSPMTGGSDGSSTSSSKDCPFQCILYDGMKVDKPKDVSMETWSKMMVLQHPPEVVSIVGADALQSRLIQQQQYQTSLQTNIHTLEDAYSMLQQASSQTYLSIQHAQTKQRYLQHQLLRLMRKVELLRGKNIPLQPSEQLAYTKLQSLSHQMDTLQHQLLLKHQQQQQLTAPQTETTRHTTTTQVPMDPSYRNELHQVLSQQRQGLEALHTIVQKNQRTVQIIQQDMKQNSSASTTSTNNNKNNNNNNNTANTTIPRFPIY